MIKPLVSDTDFMEDYIISISEESDSGCSVEFDKDPQATSGWSIFVQKYDGIPKIGDIIRLYGKGIGYTVRGIVIDGVVVRYDTEAFAEQKRLEDNKAQEEKQKLDYLEKKDEYSKRIATLPKPFQEKIEGHMRRRDDFSWKNLSYELFVCEEAVKIVKHFGNAEEIRAYSKLGHKEQEKILALDEGHSGNTFGAAVSHAVIYKLDVDWVSRAHAAIHVIVGCEEAGCWSVYEGKNYTE